MAPLSAKRIDEQPGREMNETQRTHGIQPPIRITEEMRDRWIVVSLVDRTVLGVGKTPDDALHEAHAADSDPGIAIHFVSGSDNAVVV